MTAYVRNSLKSNLLLSIVAIITVLLLLWPSTLRFTNVYIDRFFNYSYVAMFFVTLSVAMGLYRATSLAKSPILKGFVFMLYVISWIPLVMSGCLALVLVSESELDERNRYLFTKDETSEYYVTTLRRGALDDLDLQYYKEYPVLGFMRYRTYLSPTELTTMGVDVLRLSDEYRDWYLAQHKHSP